MEEVSRCYTCKQLQGICALNPAVARYAPGGEQHIYQLKWTRFNGYMLTNAGKISSWGKPTSARGRIKTPAGKKEDEPVPIPIFQRIIIVEISCGTNHILALEAQLFVWSWGYNAKGQLGIPDPTEEELKVNTEDQEKMMQRRPERLNKLNEICRVHAYLDMSFAVSVKGKLFSWGDNSRHQLCLPETIVRQPKLIPDMPWYEGGKKPGGAAVKLEDERNEALEKVMARLDISEMKLLKEDNRDLKRRLTNHVKKLNEKESDAFMESTEPETQDPELRDELPRFQFESTSQINDSIVKLIHESLTKKIAIENEISQKDEQLTALKRKIEGILERSNGVAMAMRSSEPPLEALKAELSLLDEKIRLMMMRDEAAAGNEDETLGRGVMDTPTEDPLEDLETKRREVLHEYKQAKENYDKQVAEMAKHYEDLSKNQMEFSIRSQEILNSKVEKERLQKLIEVYHATNQLTEDKLSDDYFESHKKVITANLNFLYKTQVILNETIIMELSKVVPISSTLELLDVSRTIMQTMDEEIRMGIKKFSAPAMRKLNRLWRIVGMNYSLMGFVQDAVEELTRSTHHEVISEDKYHPNPYWNAKRQDRKTKTATTAAPFTTREKTKDDTTRHYRECCF